MIESVCVVGGGGTKYPLPSLASQFLRTWGSGSSPLEAFLAGSWCTFCHSRERNQVPFHAFTIIIMAASARAPHSYLTRFFKNCPKGWFGQILTYARLITNFGSFLYAFFLSFWLCHFLYFKFSFCLFCLPQ